MRYQVKNINFLIWNLFLLICISVNQQVAFASEDEGQESKSEKSNFFPDWGTQSFNWGIGPILGFKQQHRHNDSVNEKTYQTEFGGIGYVQGLPLFPGNPGISIRPSGGYVLGSIDGTRTNRLTSEKIDVDRDYSRYWVSNDFNIYAGWYRHILNLTVGRRVFDDDVGNLRSFAVGNDFGVLLLPWFSQHLSHRYVKANFESQSEPFLVEQDMWLNSQMFFDLGDLSLRVGPGAVFAKETSEDDSGLKESKSGRADYVKFTFQFNPFWKIQISNLSRYVYTSTEKELGDVSARAKLPDEGLYDVPSIIMPEDSLVSTSFVGVYDLLLGFGIGYRVNEQILNLGEKSGRERDQTEEHGIVVTYQTKF